LNIAISIRTQTDCALSYQKLIIVLSDFSNN
jgi:hypothetical protein